MKDALEVFEQIREATHTMRKLPRVAVRNRFCNWPDFIRDYHSMYDPDKPDKQETAPTPFVPPTPKQLSDMDRVILWLAWLSQYGREYPKIIWAKADGYSVREIAKVVRMPKSTCYNRFEHGLLAIQHALHKGVIN